MIKQHENETDANRYTFHSPGIISFQVLLPQSYPACRQKQYSDFRSLQLMDPRMEFQCLGEYYSYDLACSMMSSAEAAMTRGPFAIQPQ